jgi:hypothetical protein
MLVFVRGPSSLLAAAGAQAALGVPTAAWLKLLWLPACLQLGFRQTWVSKGQLLHNGRPIMLRGVNRHEWDERAGKVVTEEHMVQVSRAGGGGWCRCEQGSGSGAWCTLVQRKRAGRGVKAMGRLVFLGG